MQKEGGRNRKGERLILMILKFITIILIKCKLYDYNTYKMSNVK